MKKLMYLLCIAVFASCTNNSYDTVSEDLYPMKILVQDSTGIDTAYVDLASSLVMSKSILNPGDWIPVVTTPIGYVHTLDTRYPLEHVEIRSFLGIELPRTHKPFPTSLVKFVSIIDTIPDELTQAIKNYLPDSVLINGEKWDIQETGPYGNNRYTEYENTLNIVQRVFFIKTPRVFIVFSGIIQNADLFFYSLLLYFSEYL